MLDSNFNLKVIDFGFAAPNSGRTGNGFLNTECGTKMYKAPEIYANENYQGNAVDIFAASVCCFALRVGTFPFGSAQHHTDSLYRLIIQEKLDEFWKYHAGSQAQGFFNSEFVNLFTYLFQRASHHRLPIADILGHPWMKGPIANADEARQEFQRRRQALDDI
jgi:5'-AMP-activated protein kinase catalytic alpha subunit